MTGLSMTSASGWLAGLGFGALYGVLFGAMITLAECGVSYGHAQFIVPVSALTGALSGLLIVWLVFQGLFERTWTSGDSDEPSQGSTE